jgi:anti-sigma regulatory factor (Ser/Thr protein kinase)
LYAILPEDPASERYQTLLAVHELCMNIVQHAYAGASGMIRIEAQASGHVFRFDITDQAPNGYEAETITVPDPLDLPESGWGMFILEQVMDEMIYTRTPDGNHWQLVKHWKGS